MAGVGDGADHEPDEARTKLMTEAAAQMDAIEADFGDDFEILATISVVALKRPDGQTGIRVRNANMSPFEAIGVLSVAQDFLKAQAMGGGDEQN